MQNLEKGEILIKNKIKKANKFDDLSIRSMMQVVFQDPYSSFNPRHRIKRLIAEPFFLINTIVVIDVKWRLIFILQEHETIIDIAR